MGNFVSSLIQTEKKRRANLWTKQAVAVDEVWTRLFEEEEQLVSLMLEVEVVFSGRRGQRQRVR